MDRCGLSWDTAQGILVAAGEACANAIEHGYRDTPPGAIRLRLEATAGELFLSVTDTGRWRPPRPEADPMRGRGIKLMRAIMRKVTFLPSPHGTTVDMHMRIPG